MTFIRFKKIYKHLMLLRMSFLTEEDTDTFAGLSGNGLKYLQ